MNNLFTNYSSNFKKTDDNSFKMICLCDLKKKTTTVTKTKWSWSLFCFDRLCLGLPNFCWNEVQANLSKKLVFFGRSQKFMFFFLFFEFYELSTNGFLILLFLKTECWLSTLLLPETRIYTDFFFPCFVDAFPGELIQRSFFVEKKSV